MRKKDRNENKIKEPTEDGQACEHNKTFEERCGNKHETITVVSILFINVVINFHCLALRIFMSSQQLSVFSAPITSMSSTCVYSLYMDTTDLFLHVYLCPTYEGLRSEERRT